MPYIDFIKQKYINFIFIFSLILPTHAPCIYKNTLQTHQNSQLKSVHKTIQANTTEWSLVDRNMSGSIRDLKRSEHNGVDT